MSCLLHAHAAWVGAIAVVGTHRPPARRLARHDWWPRRLLRHDWWRRGAPARRFVLSGANIMAPGLTSAGGHMDEVPAESVVAIMAEGKEHALAIGITTMATAQIRSEKYRRVPGVNRRHARCCGGARKSLPSTATPAVRSFVPSLGGAVVCLKRWLLSPFALRASHSPHLPHFSPPSLPGMPPARVHRSLLTLAEVPECCLPPTPHPPPKKTCTQQGHRRREHSLAQGRLVVATVDGVGHAWALEGTLVHALWARRRFLAPLFTHWPLELHRGFERRTRLRLDGHGSVSHAALLGEPRDCREWLVCIALERVAHDPDSGASTEGVRTRTPPAPPPWPLGPVHEPRAWRVADGLYS